MKRSISTRFTVIFISLIIFILVAMWAVNSWYLEDFYMIEKLDALDEVYEQINHEVMEYAKDGRTIINAYEDPDEQDEINSVALLLKEVSEKYNLTIVVSDSLTGETLSQWDFALLKEKMQKYIYGDPGLPEAEVIREADNYIIQKAQDQRTKALYLESWGYFSDNRTVFIISTPLASIQESVVISNRFLAYVGIITMLISSIVVYVTTKRVTKPIKELALLSEQLSKLNFDAKYTGNAQDEIGVLGFGMNTLAERLKLTIGELKSANHQLQKDIQKKIEIDEMRKDFIANVSHELKTPIALIQGYAEGLSEGMCADEESRDYYCQVIIDESGKMNKMVSQLLTLTALEFGKDQVVIERFDIVDLIRGMISSMDIMIQQKDAKIIFEHKDPVYVWADEFKIEQVVMNYLSNALNHLEGENEINITISQQDVVTVTVENTGKPIPAEALPQIWNKFYKVDKARTREYGGSGIGLSIVKAIMDSHRQTCGVKNTDKGVAFWFTLEDNNDICG